MVAALYRRYRPEAFAEMIGQAQVTDPLMTALRTGRIGHAYLFSGPRGCGKTTSARILARCLNCAEGPTDTPCGVCPSCVELSRDGGGSLDVVEIDAASHGGVDDARDLRERAVFAPARDRFKIFIIDEAHMVTPGGFNALLKIVEEPPPHVKFVFATTEPDKVIGTIRSRTHHYPFRLIAPGTLIDYVQSLCDSEGVQVEPGVLPLVVRAGGGSVRDTLSILDQLIAGSETALVTAERAAGLLGFTHTELLDDVVSAFGQHDPAAAFRATDRVVQTGQDPRRFVEDLLERLRDLIVVSATSVDGAAAVFRGVPEDQLTRMFEQAQRFGRGELSRVADVVSAALDQMAGATAPRLQLELMIARVLVQAAGTDQSAVPAQTFAAPGNQAGAQAGMQPRTAPQAGTAPAAAGPVTPAAPAAPAAPAVNPLSAVAAARNAAATPPQPAAQQPAAPQQAPATPAPSAGQPAPVTPAPAVPNAAQTAASIRDFLREEDAAAAPQPAQSAAAPAQPSAAPAPGQSAPAQPAPAPAQGQAAPAPAQAVPGAPAAQAPDQAPPAPEQAAPAAPAQTASAHTEPAQTPPAPAQPAVAPAKPAPSATPAAGEPHPNAGVAKFGRPITDVLSAAQVASIGAEPTRPYPSAASAPAQASPSTPEAAAPVASATGPASPAAPVAGTPETGVTGEHPSDEVEDDGHIAGFDDLMELWPDLLDELLESNRDAWNAVRPVTPLALDGEVLTVGLASGSDLAAFKAAGAGPLRETILSAVGISVKYKPTRLQAGSAPGAQTTAREPRPDADAEEPHRAGADDPVARATARLNGLGPALSAPAWADPVPAPPQAAAPEAPAPHVTSAPHGTPTPPQASAAEHTPGPATPHEATAPEPAAALAAGAMPPQVTPRDDLPTASAPEQRQAPAQRPAPEQRSAPDQRPAPGGGPAASDPADPFAHGDPYSDLDALPSGDSDEDAYGASDPYAAAPAPAHVPAPTQVPAPAPTAASAAASTAAQPQPQPQPQPQAPASAPAQAPAQPAVESARGPADSAPPTDAPPTDAPPTDAPPTGVPQRTTPTFTRYGEAVVREVLGARFVEERPLPPR